MRILALTLCLCLMVPMALAGNTKEEQYEGKADIHASEWNLAFQKFLDENDLDGEQEALIRRALQMGHADTFRIKDEADWKVVYGEAITDVMREAREILSTKQYVELVGTMKTTQHFLLEMAAIPILVCNCYGLCDCADVDPRYSRCHSTPCLTYCCPSGPTKVCQYQ